MICEKCWNDAYILHLDTGKSQYTCYLELLKQRKDNPCKTAAQQANGADAEQAALLAEGKQSN